MFRAWKAASSTLALRLRIYNQSPYSHFFYFNKFLNRVTHGHITCAEFTHLPESNLGYFTASFVRNPYDRVYSGFRQLIKDINEQPFLDYPELWIRDRVKKQLAENFEQLVQASFEFNRWFDLIREEQVYHVGVNTNFPLHPSHYWTHNAGRQFVDFIGKVENFEEHFNRFLRLMNIDNLEVVNANVVELESKDKQEPFGYRYTNRMSKKTIEKINRIFCLDFELFNYEPIK